jgi:hypothetical protein
VKKNESDALSYRQRRADYSSSSPTSYLESATELPQPLSDTTKSDTPPGRAPLFFVGLSASPRSARSLTTMAHALTMRLAKIGK